MRVSRNRLWVVAAAPLFCVLASANSAGYRYGVSDLAFYLPAAFRDLDPRLYPRDGALLDVQARLTLADECLASALQLGRTTGLSDEGTIYVAHVVALVLFYAAAVALGTALFRSWWSVGAFVIALTLRHAVARSGVNTLEGYFHPRVLAFAMGVAALAIFVRRGVWLALGTSLAACLLHTTTGLWFVVALGAAGVVSDPKARPALLAIAAASAALGGYAVIVGPLAGRLRPMDPTWLAVLADKDYLFPDRWPLDAWLIPGGYVIVIGLAATVRYRSGALTARERGLLGGAASLLLIFLGALPLLLGRRTLALQLQPARVFWLLDLLAVVGVVWIAEAFAARRARVVPAVLAIVLLTVSAARGLYLMTVQFPERSIFSSAAPPSAWQDVMRWASTTDRGSHWLVHPSHTFLYGSGVRVSGMRDVFVEGTKDPAIAMYDRDVAMRVAERLPLVSDFDALTPDALRELARRYDLDFMVTERALPLPIVYRRAPFTVYRLR